jgi:hypothetical protein
MSNLGVSLRSRRRAETSAAGGRPGKEPHTNNGVSRPSFFRNSQSTNHSESNWAGLAEVVPMDTHLEGSLSNERQPRSHSKNAIPLFG